jgi:hypothetical protein
MTEQDILGIGSKLNSAYLFRKQDKPAKPSAPGRFPMREYLDPLTTIASPDILHSI